MRYTRTAVVLVAAASVISLAGCMPMIASEPMTSEERAISDVTTVVLDSSGDLTITEGEPSLVIHASEAALDRLTSDVDVDDDTLTLGHRPGPAFGLGEVRYELTVPDLEAIELNGSGDIDATVSTDGSLKLDLSGSGDVDWTGLDAERVEIAVSGSGDIELGGAASALAIEIDGSGSVDAEDLRVRGATVAISGSGDVDVSVSEKLFADISGSGRVTYSGDPSIDTDISGSGGVDRG